MSLTQINKAGLDELALDHVFTIGASGTDHYTFQGEGLNGTVNDPTLYLTRGKTYRFENGSGGHPIRIQSTSGASGTAYNTGVTNNAGSGTVIVEVQHDAPDVLYYQCTSHANMGGTIYVTGALADGNVTTAKIAANAVTSGKIASNAVTTSELGDDAVTSAKIADNAVVRAAINAEAVSTSKIEGLAVTTAKIAANAVTNPKIVSGAIDTGHLADQAVTLAKLPHGTSSNDGKFLRANNGADPSFETVTSTTINSNANNRIITGSDTANTLNGESALTFNNSTDTLQVHQTDTGNNPAFKSIHRGGSGSNINAHFTNYSGTSNTVILHNGSVGVGTTSPDQTLHVHKGSAGSIDSTANSVLTLENSTDSILQFLSPSTNVNQIRFGDPSDNGAGYIDYDHNTNRLAFGTAGPERMRIDASGRVGIGETSPDGDLHIKSSNPAIYLEDSTNSSQHGQAIIEQNGDNLKIRQDAGNASSGSNSNISFQVDAAERVKIAHLGDSEYGFKFLNSKAIEFKDSNMELCTLSWSISANTWTNFFSASQNHMSWLFLNSIHNSGNSSALWALSDSWSGGSSYATRKIHQNNYGPADVDIQRNGVWWQIRSGYATYGYAILMVLSGGGSVANLSG